MYLVGILHDEVLALLQLHAGVDDAAQDAPGIVHVQVDLAGKLHRLELLGAQDHVLGRVLDVQAGHVSGGRHHMVTGKKYKYTTNVCPQARDINILPMYGHRQEI